MNRLIQRLGINTFATIKSGGFWVLGRAGIALLSVVIIMILTRVLSREDYGAYQYIMSVLAVLSITSLYGMDIATVQSFVNEKDGTLIRAVKTRIHWGLLGAGVALLFALWYFIQGNVTLGLAFSIGAVFAPFREAFSTFAAYWNGRSRFDLQAKYTFLSFFIHTIGMIIVALLFKNLLVVLGVFLLLHTVSDFFFYTKTKKSLRNTDIDREGISFGKHLSLMDAFEALAGYIDKIIVWQLLGGVPVAIYSLAQLAAQKVSEMMPIIPLALPKLSTMNLSESKGKIRKIFYRSFLILIPIAALGALCAPFLFSIFFPNYPESVKYFQALLLLVPLAAFDLPYSALLVSMKTKELYFVRIGVPIIKIILLFIGVFLCGIWGAVFAVIGVKIVRGVLLLGYFSKVA